MRIKDVPEHGFLATFPAVGCRETVSISQDGRAHGMPANSRPALISYIDCKNETSLNSVTQQQSRPDC